MCYLFIETYIGDSEPWQGELGKTIMKDSDASDLPACKGTLAICQALGICNCNIFY